MRKFFLIIVGILSLLLIISLLVLLHHKGVFLKQTIPFTTIVQDSPEIGLARYQKQEFLVIRTQEDWENLWNTKVKLPNFKSAPSLPTVDFPREMVIAVFYGKTYEWSCNPKRMVEIEEINEQETKISVRVIMDKKPQYKSIDGPPPLAMSPFHIIRLARSTLPIEFNVIDSSSGLISKCW
jgi:hypothetical protein